MIKKSQASQLTAYSDADWSGNLDDRTSTTIYIVYLGANLIA